MPFLSNVSITFNTHDDDKGQDTVLHVFVKNRLSTSLSPERNRDFIENKVTFDRYQSGLSFGDDDVNPYLATGISLAPGIPFGNGSSYTFDLLLRSPSLSSDDIVLPVVNIHILPDGHSDRWKFDYTITFTFDNGSTFSSSSNTNGVTGIVLDQDNHNYSGICVENPFRPPDPIIKPDTDAVLTAVILEFSTHHDDKNSDTRLNVHIVNRLNATSNQDLAIGLDLFEGERFPDTGLPSDLYKSFRWSAQDGTLPSSSIRLQDIVLPVVNIIIYAGTDQWIFDYQVTFEFTDPQKNQGKPYSFSSRTNGVVLDQYHNKHSGVYQGASFPRFAPRTAPQLSPAPVQHVSPPKPISLAFLQSKLDEFINYRQGANFPWDAPLNRVRLHNSGLYGPLPESYFDHQAIMAWGEGVAYLSSPISLGQVTGAPWFQIGSFYFNNVVSNKITLRVDTTQPRTPFTLRIEFDCSGSQETVAGKGGDAGTMDFNAFSITVKLTLDLLRKPINSGHKVHILM